MRSVIRCTGTRDSSRLLHHSISNTNTPVHSHTPANTQLCEDVRSQITKLTLQVMQLLVTEVQSESFGLVTERCNDSGMLCAVTHIFANWISPVSVTHITFFITEYGIVRFLCTTHVFKVRALSSSSRLPLCQILFVSQPPLLSYLTEINCVLNQSLTHPVIH